MDAEDTYVTSEAKFLQPIQRDFAEVVLTPAQDAPMSMARQLVAVRHPCSPTIVIENQMALLMMMMMIVEKTVPFKSKQTHAKERKFCLWYYQFFHGMLQVGCC